MYQKSVLRLVSALILLQVAFASVPTDVTSNFGKYKVHAVNYTTCFQNGADFVYRTYEKDGKSQIQIVTRVNKPVKLVKCKMQIGRYNGTSLIPMIKYTMQKPCDHFFIGPVLRTTVHVKENCNVPAGFYNVTLDMDDSSHKMFGDKFFRGFYRTRLQLFEKIKCIACIQLDFEMLPI